MKHPTARTYDRTADGYKRYWAPVLAPWSADLIERLTTLEPKAATEPIDVLDVGCGTGNLTFEAIRRWPGARVTGLDLSDGMLAVAERDRAELPAQAAARVAFVGSDAARTPFEAGSFDVVMSGFVVQQVGDRLAVLREFRRVLRPNGLAGICGWLKSDFAFRPDAEMDAALEDVGVVLPPAVETRAGHYTAVEQAVRELAETGFTQIQARPANLEHRWSVEDYVAYRTVARDVELVGGMEPLQRQAFLASFERRLRALPAEALIDRQAMLSLTARAG